MVVSRRERAFPFAELPSIPREEIDALRCLRDVAQRSMRVEKVAARIEELVDAPVSITMSRARPMDLGRIPSDAIGVAFAPSDAPRIDRAVLIDVESALANALVTRALRQRVPQVSDASRGPLSAEVAGAFAALLHTALRRAQGQGQEQRHATSSEPATDAALWRVVAAGPAQVLARDLVGANRSIVTAWLRVVVGEDAFDARVSLGMGILPPVANKGLSNEALRSMNDAPIAVPLVVHTCSVSRAELASLRVGDAFVVPTFPLQNTNGELLGPVALVCASGERGLGGDLAEGGRLVLRTERVESHPWDQRSSRTSPADGSDMKMDPEALANDNEKENATLEVLEDAPVIVRIELGVVEMKAREWADLHAGDVVTLGRKLGEPAILRVGGVEVARGELVQVDGEYGVRILKRRAPQT